MIDKFILFLFLKNKNRNFLKKNLIHNKFNIKLIIKSNKPINNINFLYFKFNNFYNKYK